MGTRDKRDYFITGRYLYGNQRQKGLLYNRRISYGNQRQKGLLYNRKISVWEPEIERITL